jgi:hypothetical protein
MANFPTATSRYRSFDRLEIAATKILYAAVDGLQKCLEG